jgi:hypothetical protein
MKSKMLTPLPKRAWPIRDTQDPKRAKERRLSADPRLRKSITEQVPEPNVFIPKVESPLPYRWKDRKLSVLPMWRKSRIAREEPTRDMLRSARPEPM